MVLLHLVLWIRKELFSHHSLMSDESKTLWGNNTCSLFNGGSNLQKHQVCNFHSASWETIPFVTSSEKNILLKEQSTHVCSAHEGNRGQVSKTSSLLYGVVLRWNSLTRIVQHALLPSELSQQPKEQLYKESLHQECGQVSRWLIYLCYY